LDTIHDPNSIIPQGPLPPYQFWGGIIRAWANGGAPGSPVEPCGKRIGKYSAGDPTPIQLHSQTTPEFLSILRSSFLRTMRTPSISPSTGPPLKVFFSSPISFFYDNAPVTHIFFFHSPANRQVSPAPTVFPAPHCWDLFFPFLLHPFLFFSSLSATCRSFFHPKLFFSGEPLCIVLPR